MGMFWRGEHTFAELHALGGDIGAYPPPKLTYYVDKLGGGSDSNTGLGSWRNAKATYQAGVTAATCADNRYRDVDLIIAPAEYDEQVEVSGIAQGDYQASTWYGWRMGRLRIIAMGEKVILKNSGDADSYTLNIGRKKVELHGGTFRGYYNSGHMSVVHWERELYAYASDVKGDVIGGAMYGCRVEGRSSQKVGIHFDAACYVHVEDCWISGFSTGTGVLESANNLGYPLENVVTRCRFRDNTNDIMIGGSTFFLMKDNIHMDAGTTYFIGTSIYAGHTGPRCTDGFCAGAIINVASITSSKVPTISGLKMADTHTQDR